jgi:hypothetical protein
MYVGTYVRTGWIHSPIFLRMKSTFNAPILFVLVLSQKNQLVLTWIIVNKRNNWTKLHLLLELKVTHS